MKCNAVNNRENRLGNKCRNKIRFGMQGIERECNSKTSHDFILVFM